MTLNNTVHGRKEIRNSHDVKKSVVKYRFLIFTATVLIVGGLIGALIGKNAAKQPEPIQAETQVSKNDRIMTHVKQFGTYDNRCFTTEISMDWGVGDLDFTPLNCDMDEETQEFVFYLCEGYNIDWTLVMAMIQHESDFDAECISSTNDYGLMQINKCNHEWLEDTLGVNDFLDSKQNVRAGVFVLRKLFEEYGDTNMVLMSYNMGSGGASRLWDEGIYESRYSKAVLEIQKEFNEQLEKGKDGDQ